MLCIEDLPNEILLYILKFLSLRDKTKIRLVNKHFYNLSTDQCLIKDEELQLTHIDQVQSILESTRIYYNIHFNPGYFDPAFDLIFHKLGKKLIKITLQNCEMNETQWQQIFRLCQNIKSLTLLYFASMLSISKINCTESLFKELLVLNITRTRNVYDANLWSLLSQCPKLETLSLSYCELNVKHVIYRRFYTETINDPLQRPSEHVLTIQALAHILKNKAKTLKHLDLSHTKIDDEGLKNVCQNGNLKLLTLNLDECLELKTSLMNLGKWQPYLVELNISRIPTINNAIFNQLCQTLEQLEIFNCSCLDITHEGLTNLIHLKNIKVLNFNNCKGLSRFAIIDSLNDHQKANIIKLNIM